jgi:hypothetical protein
MSTEKLRSSGFFVDNLAFVTLVSFTTKCFMILRSPTENENADRRHAGMDGRHPGVQDASGDIRVGLDSSTPCWNDGIEGFYFN